MTIMSIGPNIHFPPELLIKDRASSSVREACSAWSRIPLAEPKLAERNLSVHGYAPQHPFYPVAGRLRPVWSPHGFLFRTEDNISFVAKVMAGARPSIEGELAEPGSLGYRSVSKDMESWTPCIPRLCFSLANYGAHWEYHFSTAGSDLNMLSLMGLELERARVLLLAIAPRNRIFLGLDPDELVIRGTIGLERIFILNDSPALFDKLIASEKEAFGFSEETEGRIREKFAQLERAAERDMKRFGVES